MTRSYRYYVNRPVKTGIGIKVGSELDPQGRKFPNHSSAGKMTAAFKGHVFRKMRQTTLVFVFHNASGAHGKPQFRLSFGHRIAAYVIRNAVFQLSVTDSGIRWHIFYVHSLSDFKAV